MGINHSLYRVYKTIGLLYCLGTFLVGCESWHTVGVVLVEKYDMNLYFGILFPCIVVGIGINKFWNICRVHSFQNRTRILKRIGKYKSFSYKYFGTQIFLYDFLFPRKWRALLQCLILGMFIFYFHNYYCVHVFLWIL